MKKDKKIQKKLLSAMAATAKNTSEVTANIPCIWWGYQPKTPTAVKKMRKF